MHLLQRIADWLIKRARTRAPNFTVWADATRGVVYLNRWWLIPRNPIFNVYLHQFLASDDDRALHCHPWGNLSIILRGRYTERRPLREGQANGFDYLPGHYVDHVREQGDWHLRPFGHLRHRLMIEPGTECWTLFITGPVYRRWGFFCRHGWVHWAQFTAPSDKGQIGRGCA